RRRARRRLDRARGARAREDRRPDGLPGGRRRGRRRRAGRGPVRREGTGAVPRRRARAGGGVVTLLSIRGLTVHHGLLRAVDGLDAPTSGTVHLDGRDITRFPARRRVSAGIALVPEGRRLFRSLTVEENLLTGAYRGRPGPWSLEAVYELFPWMPDRRRQNAA